MTTKELICHLKKSGKLGVFKYLEENQLLTIIAQQAQDITADGVQHNGLTTKIAYTSAVNQFGQELVERAIKLYNKQKN